MKNILIMLTLCLIINTVKSQNYYGEYDYPNNGFTLSSGNVAILTATSGFVMASYSPFGTSSGDFFNILRTTASGTLGTGNFSKDYSILYDATCSTPATLPGVCYGVSVIETNTTAASPTTHYVVTGAYNEGVFVTGLSTTGTVTFAYTWLWGSGATGITQPYIVETTQGSGFYFICGAVNGQMYLIRTDPLGAGYTQYYNIDVTPNAILHSPYSPYDITIVGETSLAGPNGADGFFFQADYVFGTTLNYLRYDINNADQGFYSMAIANCTSNGPAGFVIGGRDSGTPGFSGYSWMLKLDPTGNISSGDWDTRIEDYYDQNAGPVVGVVERLNTSGAYEYYGLLKAPTGVYMIKLDASGTPPGNDDYSFGFLSAAQAVALSYINTVGGVDEGIQVYAFDTSNPPVTQYFSESCFSGQTGCSSINNIPHYAAPTINLSTPAVTPSAFTNTCSVSIIPTQNTPSINLCYAGAPQSSTAIGGNNARSVPTGIKTDKVISTSISVYPNPTHQKVCVKYAANNTDNLKIELYDYLGRFIQSVPVSSATKTGLQTSEIDFEHLNLESGIYIISATLNGASSKQKIMYNKEQ